MVEEITKPLFQTVNFTMFFFACKIDMNKKRQ